MPVIKKIPASVLWGYFAYMDIDSLTGTDFGRDFWYFSLLLNDNTRFWKERMLPSWGQ
ncbi:hypothetical protein Dsin_015537 [Dipteronia sinensis]|uniref:Uncharacterized protein n=1 Tax=Dipteronia sinensis TaxID=43782 RepID=A0AAE0E4N0_9ROSI|nr:hypothetical protein Dsin_015537 [Dipteronia sinensis]